MTRLSRRMRTLSAELALTVAILTGPSLAHAIVIGEPVALSAIGSPLRVELAASGDLARAGECLKLSAGGREDGLLWVRDARISVSGRGRDARIVVVGTAPVFEPVVKLAIEEICDARLRREYTLLLSFPDIEAPTDIASRPPSADVAAPAPQPPAAAPAPRAVESPPSVREPRSAARKDQASASRSARASRPAEAPSRPAPAPAAPAPRNDRLVLGGDEVPGGEGLRLSTELASVDRIRLTSDSERDQLRREQRVVMALDRTILAQIELSERIRELEEIQATMLEHARNLGAARASQGEVLPAEKTGPASVLHDWLVPSLVFITLSLLLAAGLLALRRRRHEPETDLEGVLAEPTFVAPPEVVVAPAAPSPVEHRPVEAEPADQNAVHETGAPGPERAPLQWHSAQETQAAPVAIDEEAEEHESAIELAEIMMGFGRVQGAAETLVEFINSNPKKSVTPWLKLLEVYRAGGYRVEFDALARQLNKTFNVKSVTWDTFEEARKANNTIEQMAHVIANVQRVWGTHECQAYLEKLLRDNRDGTREGFPLSVIDEILMLADVLEEQLGVYRPTEATLG